MRKKFIKSIVTIILLTIKVNVWAENFSPKLEMLGEMKYISVTALRTAQRNGMLNIQTEFTNRSPNNQLIYYRFKWLDSDGFIVWEDEAWKPTTIYGKQKMNINIIAPSRKATDYRLELQSRENNAIGADASSPIPGH